MKINNKAFAVIAGIVLLIAAWVISTHFPAYTNNDYGALSEIVLDGLALTVIFMGLLAIIYSVLGVEDSKQALGLPEGSVRALLAFSLVLIFVCLAVFLFGEVNKTTQPAEGKTLTRVTDAQLSDLKADFVVASELTKDADGKVIYEQIADPKDQTGKGTMNDLKHPLYTATYYPKASKDAEDFGKQIFTTLATVFVSVVSFYFGSSVTTSAAVAGAKAAGAGKVAPLQAALTNALADSHNAQAAFDKATQALAAATDAGGNNPTDQQKADIQAAQKALDAAKLDLQDKQTKVEAAQKALNDADPTASKSNAS
jgi:hypothetical protein